jgi:glycosyltransferase involved in cell wall biosynthesis
LEEISPPRDKEGNESVDMEKDNLKVSIVIPTLNQGKFIKECIDSILCQSYPDIEIFVVDGGSVDGTLNILGSYGSKIRWLSEKDNGQTNAINKGMRLIVGEICGFINSDDILFPDSIETVVNVFLHTNALWVTGDYQIINCQGRIIQSPIVLYKRFLRHFSSKTMISLANYIVQPSTFWRKEIFEKIGFFDESYSFVMDYDFWMRAFEIEKPLIIHKLLSSFRIHDQSKGGTQYIQQFAEEIQVLKKYSRNPIIIGIHWLHNQIITLIYRLIK